MTGTTESHNVRGLLNPFDFGSYPTLRLYIMVSNEAAVMEHFN